MKHVSSNSHAYALCMGAGQAHIFVLQAHKVCPSDPLACNELGVLTYRNQQYSASEQWLLRALELVPGRLNAGKAVPCIAEFNTHSVLLKSQPPSAAWSSKSTQNCAPHVQAKQLT